MSESEVYLTSLAMRQIATLRTTFNGGVMMPTSAPVSSKLRQAYWDKRRTGWHATPIDYD